MEKEQDALAWLHQQLWKTIVDGDLPVPSQPTMDVLLSVGMQLYTVAEEETAEQLSLRTGRPKRHPANQTQARAVLYWVKANILHILYHVVRRLPTTDGPFAIPLIRVVSAPSFIYDITQPLRILGQEPTPVLQDVIKRFNVNMALITEEFQHKREYRATDVMTPQRYPKADFERYLEGTPLKTLAHILVPHMPFTNEQRRAHHWCLGKTGRGKTTFLRHLIRYDLQSVARGECSLVVIDSKKLVREMRTLKIFTQLKLTIIDNEPFPLNPFHHPQAKALITYMLGSMSEASSLQTGALGFLIEGALQSENPSLQTVLDYIRLDGRQGQLPKDILKFDKQTQDWFRHTFKNLHIATGAGIEQRLANFLKEHEHGLARNFNADRWGLDLETLHKGGHVLLVDTDRASNGGDGAHLLGRLVIALLEQLSSRRTKLDENSLKPIWVYIDEASDYLQNDSNFVQILIKARAQWIGTTVAYQYRGLVDPQIERALENAEIHSECVQKGTVNLTVSEVPSTLRIPELEFTREPQMTRPEYEQMREEMRARYPFQVVKPKEDGHPLTQKF